MSPNTSASTEVLFRIRNSSYIFTRNEIDKEFFTPALFKGKVDKLCWIKFVRVNKSGLARKLGIFDEEVQGEVLAVLAEMVSK